MARTAHGLREPQEGCYDPAVDPLRDHDLRAARETPPAEKLRQALEMMAWGLDLERAKLAHDNPTATAEELEALYLDFLCRHD